VTDFGEIVKITQKKACKWVVVGCMMSLVENSGTPAKGFPTKQKPLKILKI
jgi:hypothetical protein